MFLTSRRKIREVEVEVIDPGGIHALAPAELKFPDAWAEPRPEAAERERSAPPRMPAATSGGPLPVPSFEVATMPEPEQVVEAEWTARPVDTIDPESEEEADEAAAAQPLATELTCEIVFWRGYRKSAFYAQIFDEAGEPLAVAESPYFRSSGNGTPDATDEAEAAYDDLCERLERDGWNWVDQGSTWYGDIFQRDVTAVAGPEPA